MKTKKSRKSKASFQQKNVHSDKLSAYKEGAMDTSSNKSGGPTNRADSELSHMMSKHPMGMNQKNRRTK